MSCPKQATILKLEIVTICIVLLLYCTVMRSGSLNICKCLNMYVPLIELNHVFPVLIVVEKKRKFRKNFIFQ
ncbi:hypothetical protein XELAEV_18047000mg [Xenopus laevis]|uniref:Uncharacterized protein n=1 Tax=Xenopus laevis TaxID=8355 RepID=A0A974BU00_XENLA|nr:hypothetical protein XELAEV_18047000mg [Xenopus laevis]